MAELVVASQGHDVAGAILMLTDSLVVALNSINHRLCSIEKALDTIYNEMPSP